ncbi:hypothetical protein ON010_g7642 [Phytophthora cinnamomi]|nr:hypothetical protein ON010_g7642 [Phytophthora cinnamomi]
MWRSTYTWKKKQGEQGNDKTASVKEGPAVVKNVTGTLTLENISINVLCETPLVFKTRPLFSVGGETSVGDKSISTRVMLLDSDATTVYVSKHWVEKNKLATAKFSENNIRVKLEDNQVVEARLELLAMPIKIQGLDDV